MTIWAPVITEKENGERDVLPLWPAPGAHELIRRAVNVADSARHASCLIEQQGCWAINKTE